MEAKSIVDWARDAATRAFWFALALVFLIESWIWDHVKDWLRRLELALGLERLELALMNLVERLSPQMTLALFAIPMLAVAPLKFGALALIASDHVLLGVVFIFLVKSLTLGVEAFLFDICRDKLLEMEWFARLYSIVLDIRAWATLLVQPYKSRVVRIGLRLRAYAEKMLGEKGRDLARRITRLRQSEKQ